MRGRARLTLFARAKTLGKHMQPRYQIHIYHDGTRYVSDVPELDGCSGTGQSYAEALESAEKAIIAWVVEATNGGHKPPESTQDFVLRLPTRPLVRVIVKPGRIVIEAEAEPTLEQMLAAFDPKKHGGEVMAEMLADVAKRAADSSSASIDDAVSFVEKSNLRIATMEQAATKAMSADKPDEQVFGQRPG